MAGEIDNPFINYKVARDGLANHDPGITLNDARQAAEVALAVAQEMDNPFGVSVQIQLFLDTLNNQQG